MIRKCYDFALGHAGQDKDSYEIWQDYINFLKAGEVRVPCSKCFPIFPGTRCPLVYAGFNYPPSTAPLSPHLTLGSVLLFQPLYHSVVCYGLSPHPSLFESLRVLFDILW